MKAFRQFRASASNAIDQSLAYTSDVLQGSLLVIGIRESAAAATDVAVTDSQGNTWAKDYEHVVSGRHLSIFSTIAGATAACNVSVDSVNATATRILIAEYTGLWATPRQGPANGQTGDGTSPDSTPAIVPEREALVIALFGTVSDVTFTGIATGFNNRGTALLRLNLSDIIAPAGSIAATASWTGTSNGVETLIASYYEVENLTTAEKAQRSFPRGVERGINRGLAMVRSAAGLLVPDRRLVIPVGISL